MFIIMNEIIFSFERLRSWQKARELSLKVYRLTEVFPSNERYSLTSQIRRCAISIAANLAEGSGRKSPKDQAHFTTIAYGSMMELLSHLSIASDLNYLTTEELQNIKCHIKDLSVNLSNLKAAQLNHPR